MQKDNYLEDFAELLKSRILAGDNPTLLRKWIKKERGIGKSAANDFYKKIDDTISRKERESIPAMLTVVDINVEPKGKKEFEENGNTAVATVAGVKNLDELVAYTGIDLDLWEPIKQKLTVWDGKTSFSAEFKKKVEEKRIEEILNQFIDQAAKHAPKKWPDWKEQKGEYMLVLSAQDLHLSKLCWGKESGQDYDIKIAKKYYEESIDDLMNKVSGKKIEKVVLIVGSDFFQADTPNSTTTKGTFVDSDSRWTKAFSEGADLMTTVVEKLSSKYQVSLVQLGGNHDLATSYYLGLYLQAWFRNNNKVTINCSPSPRKYERFGNTLVGFCHGDSIKLNDLPLVMMRENQETISQYKWLEYITGHLHQERQVEIKGIKVRVSPALCPPDAWHDKNNFSFNVQTSQGLLYSRNDGIEAIYYSKPIN